MSDDTASEKPRCGDVYPHKPHRTCSPMPAYMCDQGDHICPGVPAPQHENPRCNAPHSGRMYRNPEGKRYCDECGWIEPAAAPQHDTEHPETSWDERDRLAALIETLHSTPYASVEVAPGMRWRVDTLLAALRSSPQHDAPENSSIANVAEWPCKNCGQSRRKHVDVEDGPLLCPAFGEMEYKALRDTDLLELMGGWPQHDAPDFDDQAVWNAIYAFNLIHPWPRYEDAAIHFKAMKAALKSARASQPVHNDADALAPLGDDDISAIIGCVEDGEPIDPDDAKKMALEIRHLRSKPVYTEPMLTDNDKAALRHCLTLARARAIKDYGEIDDTWFDKMLALFRCEAKP